MLAFSIIVALFVSVAAVAYVTWPLVDSKPAPVVIENDRLTDLIGRKDATLVAIKELEFDYTTGKLSEDDYLRMDQRLRRQAIGYIQQIEKLAPESAQLDGRIEAEIAKLRKTSDAVSAPVSASIVPQAVDQTQVVASGPTASTPAVARFCTNCGKPMQPVHKFCANCGAAVPLGGSVSGA